MGPDSGFLRQPLLSKMTIHSIKVPLLWLSMEVWAGSKRQVKPP